jgi:hypothetical protein
MKMALILAALSAQPAAQNPVKSSMLPETIASSLDAGGIIAPSIAATDRSWRARAHYTYTEHALDRRLDSRGNLKSEHVDISTVAFVRGAPVPQLVLRDGLPPSPEEVRKHQQNVDKLTHETLEERAARLLLEEQDNASLISEVPLAFDFTKLGEEVVDGRPAYVLQATPHPGYKPRGKYGKMFPKLQGKLWVDKQDFGWVKADAQVIEPLTAGLFLARILPGSRLTMEQARLGDGVWMPKHIEARATAKILLIKSLVIDRILTYSDYQPAAGGPGLPVP